MALPPPPSRTATVPPPNGAASSVAFVPSAGRFAVSTGRVASAQKVVIYGPGGIGKSSLAALAPNPVFLDVEDSTKRLEAARVSGLATWADLRACLQSDALDGYGTVVIDSVTRAEELAVAHTLATVKTEKNQTAASVESYGFGKGFQHVYETFLHLLVELDRHVRAGRNVVLIAHSCVAKSPNPMSDDFIRFEPRLQTSDKGKASIRNRVVEWADHVLYIGYDVAVSEDGKGVGAGTRTIYTKETPTQIAKTREAHRVIEAQRPFSGNKDGSIWPLLLDVAEGGVR